MCIYNLQPVSASGSSFISNNYYRELNKHLPFYFFRTSLPQRLYKYLQTIPSDATATPAAHLFDTRKAHFRRFIFSLDKYFNIVPNVPADEAVT